MPMVRIPMLGNQLSCTAKTVMSKMPNQKIGTEMPI
jgi:hypothetical protein